MTDQENDAELAYNLALTRQLLGYVGGAGCGPDRAICALLSAATVLIDKNYKSDARLRALNAFLAPTINDWAGVPNGVTIQ